MIPPPAAEVQKSLRALRADPGATACLDAWCADGWVPSADTRLHDALIALIADGNTAAALWLLNHGVDPGTPSVYGTPPLLQAMLSGNSAVAQALVAAGADPNAPDASGSPPLVRAVATSRKHQAVNSVRVAEHLGNRLDWNVTNHLKESPLMILLAQGGLDLAQRALAAGADPALRDGSNRTALDAFIEGAVHNPALHRDEANVMATFCFLADALLQRGLLNLDTSDAEITTMDRLLDTAHPGFLREILKRGGDPNVRSRQYSTRGETPWMLMVTGGPLAKTARLPPGFVWWPGHIVPTPALAATGTDKKEDAQKAKQEQDAAAEVGALIAAADARRTDWMAGLLPLAADAAERHALIDALFPDRAEAMHAALDADADATITAWAPWNPSRPVDPNLVTENGMSVAMKAALLGIWEGVVALHAVTAYDRQRPWMLGKLEIAPLGTLLWGHGIMLGDPVPGVPQAPAPDAAAAQAALRALWSTALRQKWRPEPAGAAPGFTALAAWIINCRDPGVLEDLLAAGVDVNRPSAISIANENGAPITGNDPIETATPLAMLVRVPFPNRLPPAIPMSWDAAAWGAAHLRQQQLAQRLLDAGADPWRTGRVMSPGACPLTAWDTAMADKNNKEAILPLMAVLLQHPASHPLRRDVQGRSLIQICCEQDWPAAAAALVDAWDAPHHPVVDAQRHADPAAPPTAAWLHDLVVATPTPSADLARNRRIAANLAWCMPAASSMEWRDADGNTPLILAAAMGNPILVDALLTLGADPNATNALGEAALHHAVARGMATSVADLRTHGADSDRATAAGWTPSAMVHRLDDADLARAIANPPAVPRPTTAAVAEATRTDIRAAVHDVARGWGWPAPPRPASDPVVRAPAPG